MYKRQLVVWTRCDRLDSRRVPTLVEKLHRELGRKFRYAPVSYTHLRAHETVLDLVCRLLLEKKKNKRLYDIMSSAIH